jgi:hypothetical protein
LGQNKNPDSIEKLGSPSVFPTHQSSPSDRSLAIVRSCSTPEDVLNSTPTELSLTPVRPVDEIYGSVGDGLSLGVRLPGYGLSPATPVADVGPVSALRRPLPVSFSGIPASQLVLEEVSAKLDRNPPPVSATQLRLGSAKLSDPRLASNPAILEAFRLPWEDDTPNSKGEASDSGGVDSVIEPVSEDLLAKDARVLPQTKSALNPSPALGLIKRGFLGPRAAPSAPGKAVEKPARACSDPPALPVVEGSCDRAAELGRGLSQSLPTTSPVSKSQRGYAKRVKEKVAKQLNKNKELLAESLVDVPVVGEEGYSNKVLGAMNLAPVVGMTWGGDDKKLLDLFSAMENKESKVKGLRELKSLDCTISPVKSQRRRGVVGSKNALSFPPEIH